MQGWLSTVTFRGATIVLPEITDYEVRRELIRAGKSAGLARLDALRGVLSYAPITTSVMRRAAEFWAVARNAGRPATDDTALDGDMILAAQAVEHLSADSNTVIATANTRHLEMFCDARHWRDIA